MKITGYRLREAIKEHELRRDAAKEAFDSTLAKFDDEVKETPSAVMALIESSERAIARLQTAQSAYNLAIVLEMDGEKLSLSEAVKRIGGMGRIEQTWRLAMRQLAPGRSAIRNRMMYGGVSSSEEVAKATMTVNEAREATSQACKRANKLKAAIAQANALEIEISDLDASLIP